MVKFNSFDRVIAVKDGKIRSGVLKKICYEVEPPICIVEFDDGEIEKVSIDRLAHEPKNENEQDPTTSEATDNRPKAKAEITITPDEFRKVSVEVLSEYVTNDKGNIFENLTFGMKVIPILAKIAEALFYDEISENSENNGQE